MENVDFGPHAKMLSPKYEISVPVPLIIITETKSEMVLKREIAGVPYINGIHSCLN